MGGPVFPVHAYRNGVVAVPVPPVRVQVGNGGPCKVHSPRALMNMVCGPTVVVAKAETAFVAPTELDVLLEKLVTLLDCANVAQGSEKANQSRMRR
jgi:hypothetical protein